jgi:hypothetical protein
VPDIHVPRPIVGTAIGIACATCVGIYVACRSRVARGPEWEGRVIRKWTRGIGGNLAHMIDVNDVRSEHTREVAADVWQAVRLGDHIVMERGAVSARITTCNAGCGLSR